MSEKQQNEAEEQQKEQQTAENAAAEETAANASDNTEETPAAEETQQPSELELAQKKIDELNDKYLRLSAEYDNYRKRTLKEKSDMLKSAGADILVGILPVVDDFERALAHMTDAQNVDSLREGVELIYKKFNEYLGKRGMTVIETEGKDFDTDIHEAITKIPAPTPEMKGKVIDCVQKGYKLNDKVVRFAKVVVGE
ncbi:MAG: nucleotide exchange factor GrpE [Marinilabiliaceae bacterium]|nr:nucleotide exchange factor GrpE [Marinilabiliaceae bacterium]